MIKLNVQIFDSETAFYALFFYTVKFSYNRTYNFLIVVFQTFFSKKIGSVGHMEKFKHLRQIFT